MTPKPEDSARETSGSEESETESARRTQKGSQDSRSHSKHKFFCPEASCGKEFDKKFLLKTHSAVHSNVKPWVCMDCGMGFALRARLKRHLKIHQGYGCTEENCEQKFNKWSELRKHLATKHPSIHTCEECGKKFKLGSLLRKHQQSHERQEPCPVESCEMRIFKSRLSRHMMEYHKELETTVQCTTNKVPEPRRHTCMTCGKDYTRPAHLRRHMEEVHDGQKKTIQKQFQCTELGCDRKFLNAIKLESHVNWHKGLAPFDCSEKDCLRKFCGREALCKHLRKAHGKTVAVVIQEVTAWKEMDNPLST